jgi:alpha-beta hydrolase superfamily lysophospholipase
VIEGNPVDGLERLAAAGIPIIHVCGSEDEAATNFDNNDVVQERYSKLGGEFVLIMKEGCKHHPHGLADPTPVVDYIVSKCAEGLAAEAARAAAPSAGDVIVLPAGGW